MANRVRNVPQVMQMEATECGAACLTMVLAHYGRWVPLEQVRVECGVSRDGSKAANILRAARKYGFTAKGFTYSVDALKAKAKLPCIIFWNFNHFVVLTGFSGNGKWAYLNDPARGQVRVGTGEFEGAFTGIALILEPTDDFEPGGKRTSTVDFMRERLRGMVGPVAFVALATALLAVIGVLNASMSRAFVDMVLGNSGGSKDQALIGVIVVMSVLALIQTIVSFTNAIYLLKIRGKFAAVSSSRFFWHLLHLPMSFYAQRYVGDLQRRQTSNETIAMTVVQQLAPAAMNAVLVIVYLVVMLFYSVPLALVGRGEAA